MEQKGEIAMLNRSLVLFTLAIALFASQAHAGQPAATDSDACEGALPLEKLIRVTVVKGGYSDCPRGARSPYLCALHKAGFGSRSLGYAMRNTLAALDNGTCERVNLRGVLIWKADGSTLKGDDFVDSSRTLPASELRFGAWKTRVLYLASQDGEKQLAACTHDLAACRAQVAKVVSCGRRLYDPANDKCVDKPAVAPSVAAVLPASEDCPVCPKSTDTTCPKCPTCTMNVKDARACIATRYALQQEVANLQPKVDKAKECGRREQLFNPKTGNCVPSAGLSPAVAQSAADRLATLTTELSQLRAAFGVVRACSTAGGRFSFSSMYAGRCEAPP